MSSPIEWSSRESSPLLTEEDPLDQVCLYLRISDGVRHKKPSEGRATLYCYSRYDHTYLSAIFNPENRAEGEQAARDFFLTFTVSQIEELNDSLSSGNREEVNNAVQRIFESTLNPSQ